MFVPLRQSDEFTTQSCLASWLGVWRVTKLQLTAARWRGGRRCEGNRGGGHKQNFWKPVLSILGVWVRECTLVCPCLIWGDLILMELADYLRQAGQWALGIPTRGPCWPESLLFVLALSVTSIKIHIWDWNTLAHFPRTLCCFFHTAVCLTRDVQKYRINDIVSTFMTQEGFSVSVFFYKTIFSCYYLQ